MRSHKEVPTSPHKQAKRLAGASSAAGVSHCQIYHITDLVSASGSADFVSSPVASSVASSDEVDWSDELKLSVIRTYSDASTRTTSDSAMKAIV